MEVGGIDVGTMAVAAGAVEVGKRIGVGVAGSVWVGAVENEKLHPVNKKIPTIKHNVNIFFIAISCI